MDLPDCADVIIIGGGVMGVSTAYHLASMGCTTAVKRFPLLENAGIASRWAGLYENTPDSHPIVGPVEELEGFYCIGGFSMVYIRAQHHRGFE